MGYFMQAMRDRARFTELRRDIARLSTAEAERLGLDRSKADTIAARHVYGV